MVDILGQMANLSQIRQFLRKNKINHKISDLGGEVYKVEDVIKAGVNPDQILKTLIIKSRPRVSSLIEQSTHRILLQDIERSFKTMQYCALVIRGKDRLDFKKVRRIFGSKATLASASEVLEVAGVPVGAVCPILLDVSIYIDRKALNLKHVNMGSGDLTKELEMDFSDLLSAIGKYEIADLTSGV